MDIEQKKEAFRGEMKEIKGAFVAKVLALMIGGFGLVAALAWNDAIQTLVKQIFGETSGGIVAKFAYALIVTGVLALVSMRVGRESK